MSTTTGVLATGSKPAPAPLHLVQAFVNTWDADAGRDQLVDAASAGAWFAGAGLLAAGTPLGAEDVDRARQVREAIRGALEAKADGVHLTGGQRRPLDAVAGAASLRLRFGEDGRVEAVTESADPLDAALAQVLLLVRDAQLDGTWDRLKACSDPGCRWAFYDRSHSRQGRWCDMASCGNRAKNRALRARAR